MPPAAVDATTADDFFTLVAWIDAHQAQQTEAR